MIAGGTVVAGVLLPEGEEEDGCSPSVEILLDPAEDDTLSMLEGVAGTVVCWLLALLLETPSSCDVLASCLPVKALVVLLPGAPELLLMVLVAIGARVEVEELGSVSLEFTSEIVDDPESTEDNVELEGKGDEADSVVLVKGVVSCP